MARDRLACDITRGSTWPGRQGGHARVITVAAGYVCFEDDGGAVHVMHNLRFRERFEEPYDTRRCRSQFSMSLANLANFHAFWSPSEHRMYARSATHAPEDVAKPARGRPALPADAVHVGTYAIPVSPDAFFEDLNDVLASLTATDRRPAGI